MNNQETDYQPDNRHNWWESSHSVSSDLNDMNVDNYTLNELLDIIDLNENSTLYEIEQHCDKYIAHYTFHNNDGYVDFINNIKEKLLKMEDSEDQDDLEEEITVEGFENNDNADQTPDQEALNVESINNMLSQKQVQDQAENTPYVNSDDTNRMLVDDSNLKNSTNASFIINPVIPNRSSMDPNINPDTLNPTLRQTTTKFITINSQYRTNNVPYNPNPYSTKGANSNFRCTLTETLNNVLSLQLHSVYIPESWFTFDPYIGNTTFWIYYADSDLSFADISGVGIKCYEIQITEGTYKLESELVNEINSSIQDCTAKYQYDSFGSLILDASGFPVVSYDLSGLFCCISNPTSTNSRLGFLNYTPYFIKIIYWPEPQLPVGIIDFSGNPQRNEVPCREISTYQQNAGYYFGMKILDTTKNQLITLTQSLAPLSLILSDTSANVSTQWAAALKSEYFSALTPAALAKINLKTIKALILAGTTSALGAPGWPGAYIVTMNGLVSNNFYTAAPLLGGAQYFQLILDEYTKHRQIVNSIGIAQEDTKLDLPLFYVGNTQLFSVDPSNQSVDCSFNAAATANPPIYLPTWPRQVTQAQLYALNEILANRKKANQVKNDPISSNLFATIYIPDAPTSTNKTITFVNDNTIEKRVYFGPVTIEMLHIKLIDNRGNIVNLHGSDWSLTLAVEILYQY